jgi:2,3-bisphosphoglycerate-independent phosphoglycerate mutase
MRSIVIVIPDWLGEEDVLRQTLPGLAKLSELGRISRLAPDPPVETPEALALGLSPDVVRLRQGPLTVSALGADPPDRSTHFHLSLLEFLDGQVLGSSILPSPEDLRATLELAKKLNTRALTLVEGEGRDHGLVWEGLGDLRTTPPSQAVGHAIRSALPEGDAEVILRRYIDDSINLLTELELNQIRAEEGLPLLNLLWPWGEGVRQRVPNLALKRGQPSTVFSASIRMQGLTRLAGYRHADRSKLRSGINWNLEFLAERLRTEPSSIVFIDTCQTLRLESKLEEAAWFTHRLDELLFGPISEWLGDEPFSLTLLAPSRSGVGLVLNFDSQSLRNSSMPFDLRATEEAKIPVTTSWESVQAALEFSQGE